MVQIDDSWYQKPDGIPDGRTAGGVVVRVDGDRILVALARELEYEDYVLPKGHLEGDESLEEAARREIEEEVGVSDLEMVMLLGVKERLNFEKTEWKTTHYFLFSTQQVDATPTHDTQHKEMHWVPLTPTPTLFWPEQRDLVEEHRERIVALVSRDGR